MFHNVILLSLILGTTLRNINLAGESSYCGVFYFTSIPVSRIGFILTGILSDYLRQNKRSKVPAPGQCQGAAWRQVGLAETGTEEIINRAYEKISNELACTLQIDAELLFFDEETGKKVSRYIENAVTMSPTSMKERKNIVDAARLLKKLHSSEVDTKVPFEVFDMVADYERFIRKNGGSFYEDYAQIYERIMKLKAEVDRIGFGYVPSHNDPLCENWIRSGDRMYLVDWEYAGMNSPFWDLADVSIEAGLDEEQDKLLLEMYLGISADPRETLCFQANKVYLDFLWSLWGKTRVPFDGKPMERYAFERYHRMKENLAKIKN